MATNTNILEDIFFFTIFFTILQRKHYFVKINVKPIGNIRVCKVPFFFFHLLAFLNCLCICSIDNIFYITYCFCLPRLLGNLLCFWPLPFSLLPKMLFPQREWMPAWMTISNWRVLPLQRGSEWHVRTSLLNWLVNENIFVPYEAV